MKTKTPKYRIELTCVDFRIRSKVTHRYAYNVAESGKPNPSNAKLWRDLMNKSTVNGCNSHLNGLQSMYSNAKIVLQSTGETIAEYSAPMFEVIN